MSKWDRAKRKTRSAYLKALFENQDKVKITIPTKPDDKEQEGFKFWLN